jgi:hypothetical protein
MPSPTGSHTSAHTAQLNQLRIAQMNDHPLLIMRVKRSGRTWSSGHGNEAVPMRPGGTGVTPAQRRAHADARSCAGRSCTRAGRQSEDDLRPSAGAWPANAIGAPRVMDRRYCNVSS